jgi:hypothetical protein
MNLNHQKRHADWLCTPSDENTALLSWEVILMAKSEISLYRYCVPAPHVGLQTRQLPQR